MNTRTRKIVSINIPHIFLESEKMRSGRTAVRPNDDNFVIAAGASPASMIIDAPDVLRDRKISRGMPVKNVKRLAADINIVPVDFDYMRGI